MGEEQAESSVGRPPRAQDEPGTLFVVGLVVLLSTLINTIRDGILNTLVVALVFGIVLRTFKIFKPAVLGGIDSLGPMSIAICLTALFRFPGR